MSDEIAKQEPQQLAIRPLEILKEAEEIFTNSMQRLSAALIQDCDPFETAKIHDWTKKTEKSIQAFKDNARERLNTFLQQHGQVVTEKGTLEMDFGNGWKQRAIPTNTTPSDKLTERVLRAKGLDLNVHMDKELKYCASDAKLRYLLEQELLTQAEYKQCFGELAYRIGASERVKEEEE